MNTPPSPRRKAFRLVILTTRGVIVQRQPCLSLIHYVRFQCEYALATIVELVQGAQKVAGFKDGRALLLHVYVPLFCVQSKKRLVVLLACV